MILTEKQKTENGIKDELIFQSGYNAYLSNASRWDNPYTTTSDNYDSQKMHDWTAGWLKAKKDKE